MDSRIVQLLERALKSPCGIAVASPNANYLIVELNKTRKTLARPELDALVIGLSPSKPTEEVWIQRKEARDGSPSA